MYYFINLSLHFLISLTLMLILLHYVKKNQLRKNKRGISFLLPSLLAVIFLVQVMTFTVPRILDSVNIVKADYRTVTGQVESVRFLNHALVIDGKTYYYNPLIYKPKVGDELKISFTPKAGYIADLEPLPW